MHRLVRVYITSEDLVKYPFLGLKERLDALELTLDDIAKEAFASEVLEHAKERVLAAIHRRPHPHPLEDPELEALSFITACLAIATIGDQRLAERYATWESKYYARQLKTEKSEKLTLIAVKALGWRVSYADGFFLVKFTDYLSNVPEYKGSWKLVNRWLKGGWVRLTKLEFARLVESGLKTLVVNTIRRLRAPSKLPDPIYALVETISRAWSSRLREFELPLSKLQATEEAFPPCMRKLLSMLREGKNLPHSARFALAAFLLNIGWSVDDVLEVFRSSPDFREDIARYQIEHIAGLRGSKIKYTTYKCENMRSLGLCVQECKGINHPLQYFYRQVRKYGRKKPI